MNQRMKPFALTAVAASGLVLLLGCETMTNAPAVSMQTSADDALQVSRARVVAELREAQRLGLITVGEEDVPEYTERHLRQIAKAGQDADSMQASKPK